MKMPDFCDPDGHLSANRLQKKFEDPKMALAGAEPNGHSITKLTEQPSPEDWNEQRRLYGFPMR